MRRSLHSWRKAESVVRPKRARTASLHTMRPIWPVDIRHVDHNGRVHVRDVMAGMKAVIYRRTTSNSALQLPLL
eukprot:symbB.v1.2.022366.t1/scaffold1890.1/size135764/9